MYYGNRVKLRGLELVDVEKIFQFWNDLTLQKFIGRLFPISKEEEKEWIENTWDKRKEGTGYTFAIETLDGEWVGTCGIFNVQSIHRSALIGIAIQDKDKWNKGYGTDTMITLSAFGFQLLNLNRIELEVFEFNERAIRVYEKIGYSEIGRRRQSYYCEGKYYDAILMDILRSEFLEKYPDIDLKSSE